MFDKILKCFCIPEVITLMIILAAFGVALFVFFATYFIVNKAFSRWSLVRGFFEAVKWPYLFILLEVAAAISIPLIELNEKLEKSLLHALTIAIVATVGWNLAKILQFLFHYFTDRYEKEAPVSLASRGLLTQLLFLYRLIMLVIVIVTAGIVLMTFPHIKAIGVGILGSAGIAGLALGIAARPILLNIMAGFQIAFTKTLEIGDAVFVEGDFARIEKLNLTHVIARTWDLRRIVFPISYFIDKPFQNWDATDPELVGYIFLYCDFRMPIEPIRQKAKELLDASPLWNKKYWRVQVTNILENHVEVRVDMTANDASATNDLKSYMREKLVEFIQKEYPDMFPAIRQRDYNLK